MLAEEVAVRLLRHNFDDGREQYPRRVRMRVTLAGRKQERRVQDTFDCGLAIDP
jgi:hypothetical protein